MNIVKSVIYTPESGVSLADTKFFDCSFLEYNLYHASINNCEFINCKLDDSNLARAIITNCKFKSCSLDYCNMIYSVLLNCRFIGCHMFHGNMCYTTMEDTIVQNSIFQALFKELEWANNQFDYDTLVQSCGGTHCGMTDDMIDTLLKDQRGMSA